MHNLSYSSDHVELNNWFEPLINNAQADLVVATVLSDPYVMKDVKEKRPIYKGFAMDLIEEVAKLVDFKYTIVVKNEYGVVDDNGNWSGIIGDVIDGRADLAVADLTINYDREKVVDFSMPFLDLGISILYVSEEQSRSHDLFSFLTPFSSSVWWMMLVSGLVVSLIMYLIANISPFETAKLDSAEGKSDFASLRHCMWFLMASWVQQGCNFMPIAFSTRTIACFWWFFIVIIIECYTANLAAFLTIERMKMPISSIHDLAKSNVMYGSIQSGSTLEFFHDHSDPFYKRMYFKMKECDECLPDSTEHGVEKVLEEQGQYAFFMESTSIEYHTERNHNLVKIGENLNSISYGIAMKKGSLLRPAITSAIIYLRQNGTLDRLKQKWWKDNKDHDYGHSHDMEPILEGVSTLCLRSLGGLFLVLFLGLLLGQAALGIELVWIHCKKKNLFI